MQSARQAIAVARKMDPKSALPYHAEYHLIYNDTFARLRSSDKAADLDPDDGLIQMHISDELMSVGRTSDWSRRRNGPSSLCRARRMRGRSIFSRWSFRRILEGEGRHCGSSKEMADDPPSKTPSSGFQYRYGDPRARRSASCLKSWTPAMPHWRLTARSLPRG